MADISAPAQTETSSQKPLMLQRRFLPMWTALSLGAFTDNMLKQALSIALVYGILTAPIIGNDSAVPIIGALFPIAMLLFSTLAGQVADKYETSMMFRRTKFVEFLLMVLAAIGFLISNSAILILALFLMGAQSAFSAPCEPAPCQNISIRMNSCAAMLFAAAVSSYPLWLASF